MYVYYKYEIKQHPVSGKCKIVRYKFDKKTDKLIKLATIYKNLDRDDAEDRIYKLERGIKA